MRASVPLAQLPPELEFPAELQGRASYDAQQQRLSFDGFMSKIDFDRLLRLSNDLQYQRALETLFQKSELVGPAPTTAERRKSSTGWWIAGIAGAAATLTGALIVFR